MQRIFWKRGKSIAPATQNHFWRVMKDVGMSPSSTPATQNDMTACFETFNKDGLCSFPHRHCDGTKEASDSRRDMLEHQNEHFVRDFRKCHTLQLKNRRVPTSFLTNRPQNRRFVRGIRRFSWHVTKWHACHGICALSPVRAALTMPFAKDTQHDTSKVLRLPRKMTLEVPKVLRLPRKMQYSFWKRGKSIAPATQNHFWRVMKDVGMSQSATPATQNEAMLRWKASKVTRFAELTIGTAIATSRGHLRTVADGCGRKRNVRRTQLYPHTPRVKREPLIRIQEKMLQICSGHKVLNTLFQKNMRLAKAKTTQPSLWGEPPVFLKLFDTWIEHCWWIKGIKRLHFTENCD